MDETNLTPLTLLCGLTGRWFVDEQMMRKRIRSLEEHTDKLVAQKDALMAKLDVWERTGNAVMLCAVGREAPLSDSDVCGEINALRQQVAELQAWKASVPVKSILWYFDVSEFSQAIVNYNTVTQIKHNTAIEKWEREMVKEVIDV